MTQVISQHMNQYVNLTGDENVYLMVPIRELQEDWFFMDYWHGSREYIHVDAIPLEEQGVIQYVSN